MTMSDVSYCFLSDSMLGILDYVEVNGLQFPIVFVVFSHLCAHKS